LVSPYKTNDGPELAGIIKNQNISQMRKIRNCGLCSFWNKNSHFEKKGKETEDRKQKTEGRRSSACWDWKWAVGIGS